jgi:hypothetical protein
VTCSTESTDGFILKSRFIQPDTPWADDAARPEIVPKEKNDHLIALGNILR